jgi:hypothetical protein
MGVGGLTIALGIASLVIAWGLINAKRWAWILPVIISIKYPKLGYFSYYHNLYLV